MIRALRYASALAALPFLAGVSAGSAGEVYDYGEYLAGECTSCHRLDGTDVGIPAIVTWPEAKFVAALQGYRRGERNNAIMQNVARSLGDEEIAALARFFNRQGTKEGKP